jgi:WW domain-binding protein 4
MADYWKSNPKYFCEVCKCWFANNKISIENHEKGLRHKGNIEKRLHETRRKAAVKEKEDEKVSETLEKIEKAAKAAYQRDKKSIVPRESSVVKAALEKEKKIKTGKLKKVESHTNKAINCNYDNNR